MKYFGVDFGTSNSVVSINNEEDVEILNIDKDYDGGDSKTLRSCLFFHEEGGVYVGSEALKMYLEDYESGRYMQSLKSLITSVTMSSTAIYGKSVSFDDILLKLISAIKVHAEKASGEEMVSAVFGRPVHFGHNHDLDKQAEDKLRQIALKAGIKNVAFQLEPIAAALSYEKSLADGEQKTVLVIDMGGGTSDFTIFKAQGGDVALKDRSKDVLAVSGVRFGGDTIDSQIMWDHLAHYFGKGSMYAGFAGKVQTFPVSILTNLKKWHLLPFLRTRSVENSLREISHSSDSKKYVRNLQELINYNLGFELFLKIEKVKRELSSSPETLLSFDKLGIKINHLLSREDLENILIGELQKIGETLSSMFEDASLKTSGIDIVFFTGGTAQIPFIKSYFTSFFGEDKICDGDAFTSVAHGLASSGYLLPNLSK